jgi:uncharacterized protein YndB with AHSA1/START domain
MDVVIERKGESMSEKSRPRNRTTLERTSDTELVITRTFNARPHIVFDALTKPEYVRRWWAPASHGVMMGECTAEVRVGGTYRYVLARAEEEFAFSGRYLELEPPRRIVYTQRFEAIPVEMGEAVITMTLEADGDGTRMVSHERYPSKEALDGALASGMEGGMRETYEQLEDLVSSLR